MSCLSHYRWKRLKPDQQHNFTETWKIKVVSRQELELDHLPLPLLLSTQLKVLRSLDRCLKRWSRIVSLKPAELTWFFHLHTVHSILSTSFFVVFAFFRRIGFDWPPNPCCFRSYLWFDFCQAKVIKEIWGSWYALSYDNCCVSYASCLTCVSCFPLQ